MLTDKNGKNINYARISLTERCNLRCRYCMAEGGIEKVSHQDILTFKEIYKIVHLLEELGVVKFRFTGGEPFVRRGALNFFENIPAPFYITTNLIGDGVDVKKINNFGRLKGINVSLDTLDKEKYSWITRGGEIAKIINNINNLEVKNRKLNTVLVKGFNDDEVEEIINFAHENGMIPRFIEKMNFVEDDLEFISMDGIKNSLISKEIIESEPLESKNSVSKYYRMQNSSKKVGFITPVSEPFCSRCNKIRIKATGDLKLCIFGKSVLNLRDLLRGGVKEKNIKEKITEAVSRKNGKERHAREPMSRIGG